jgi:hypothetical protein
MDTKIPVISFGIVGVYLASALAPAFGGPKIDLPGKPLTLLVGQIATTNGSSTTSNISAVIVNMSGIPAAKDFSVRPVVEVRPAQFIKPAPLDTPRYTP